MAQVTICDVCNNPIPEGENAGALGMKYETEHGIIRVRVEPAEGQRASDLCTGCVEDLTEGCDAEVLHPPVRMIHAGDDPVEVVQVPR